MRIIIEGNDGSGKSTLAWTLQADLGINTSIHLTNKDPRDYMFYSELLNKTDVIFDRHFISDPIYNKVFKRKSELNKSDRDALFAKVARQHSWRETLVIICTAPSIHKDDEFKEVIKNKEMIDKLYLETAKEHGYVTYDYRHNSYEDLVNMIKEFFKWKTI